MTKQYFNHQALEKRISHLQNRFIEQHCDAFLVEDPINLLYLTGKNLSLGTLLVTQHGAHLVVDGRYYESCQNQPKCTTVHLLQTGQEPLGTIQSILNSCHAIGFNAEKTSYKRYSQLNKTSNKTASDTPNWIPCSDLIREQRAIKDPTEIELLQEAARLGSLGYDFVLSQLKEGITERALADELEIFWKRQGGSGLAFEPIIAFGANSSMPHYRADDIALQRGDTVLIDIGVVKNQYHSDMTRTVFFGTPHPKIQEIYTLVDQAQKEALKLCKPGTAIGLIDKAARDLITKQGYGKEFMHGLGHGVGLEIHELPVIRNQVPYADQMLEEGMVITIEPGIYLSGIGGVRLENSILITSDGYQDLTQRPNNPILH